MLRAQASIIPFAAQKLVNHGRTAWTASDAAGALLGIALLLQCARFLSAVSVTPTAEQWGYDQPAAIWWRFSYRLLIVAVAAGFSSVSLFMLSVSGSADKIKQTAHVAVIALVSTFAVLLVLIIVEAAVSRAPPSDSAASSRYQLAVSCVLAAVLCLDALVLFIGRQRLASHIHSTKKMFREAVVDVKFRRLLQRLRVASLVSLLAPALAVAIVVRDALWDKIVDRAAPNAAHTLLMLGEMGSALLLASLFLRLFEISHSTQNGLRLFKAKRTVKLALAPAHSKVAANAIAPEPGSGHHSQQHTPRSPDPHHKVRACWRSLLLFTDVACCCRMSVCA